MITTKVYLADLRHDYLGVLTSDSMPLGIGYMKAVIDEELSEVIKTEIFAYPNDLLNAIFHEAPDVLMVSNYMWNENLNYHFCKLVKSINPEILVVMGGPNFPLDDEMKIDFLQKRNCVDIYVYGEGEFVALDIVKAFNESGNDLSLTLQNKFHSSVYKYGNRKGEWIIEPIIPRTKDLDKIPSPWLTGIMDKFFDGKLAPLWETNRGCPFTCTFCVQGTKWYTKVNYFSLERLKREIIYIAEKISTTCPQQKVLRIADSNFGMFERDIEVASFIGFTQKLYDYPRMIDATTGKNMADRIIKSLENVDGALVLYQAVQSLDNDVLYNIKRSNIKLETYDKILIELKSRGLRSSSDLILGLPGDTLKSHLTSLKKLINSGTDKVNSFQAILLKGSEMDLKSERVKYGFKTKFRLIPKNYGIYNNETVLDFEEIIVETNTLKHEEYFTARKYHFIIAIFINGGRFSDVLKILKNNNIEVWEWIEEIQLYFNNPSNKDYIFLQDFINETKAELFDTIEDLYNFYKDSKVFSKLNNDEIGTNLIYKYNGLGILFYWDRIVKLAINCLQNVQSNHGIMLPDDLYKDLESHLLFKYIWGMSEEVLFVSKKHTSHFNLDAYFLNNTIKLEKITLLYQPNPSYANYIKDLIKVWGYEKKSVSMFIKRVNINWFNMDIFIHH